MKKVLVLVVVLVAAGLIVPSAYAHCGKCAKSKKAAKPCATVKKPCCPTAKKCPFNTALGQLKLTDAQKTKIAAIRKDCAKTLACKKTCAKKAAATKTASVAKIKALLTPEQTAQLDKLMAAAKKTK